MPRFYVYLLLDPRDRVPFYVGKGCGRRKLQHLADWKAGRIINARKHDKIGEIVAAGLEPKPITLFSDLNEDEALRLERRIIAGLGSIMLTNVSEGQQTEREKAIALAKFWAARVKPFDRWMSERPREDWEPAMYHKVRAELEQMAAGIFQ